MQAWALLLLMELALRALPFQQLRALCDNAGQKGPEHFPESVPAVSRLAWLVEIAGRYTPVSATCLKKALVLRWLLGRRGIASTLQIGVAHHDGVFAAHAWLEHHGQAVLGQQERDGFAPLVPVR